MVNLWGPKSSRPGGACPDLAHYRGGTYRSGCFRIFANSMKSRANPASLALTQLAWDGSLMRLMPS